MVSTQTTLHGCRIVETASGLCIRFPLPPARGRRISIAIDARRLTTAKKQIEAALNDGCAAINPFSGNPIRIYRRSLNKSQMGSLRRLSNYHTRHPGEEWAHVADFNGRRDGDLAKLRWWGLVLSRPVTDAPTDRRRGWWAITDLGRNFLNGAARVPRQQAILCKQHLGPVDDTDLIGISEVQDETDVRGLTSTGSEGGAACA